MIQFSDPKDENISSVYLKTRARALLFFTVHTVSDLQYFEDSVYCTTGFTKEYNSSKLVDGFPQDIFCTSGNILPVLSSR